MEFTYPNEVAMKKVPLKQHSKSPFISLTNNIGNIITSNNLIACPCDHMMLSIFGYWLDYGRCRLHFLLVSYLTKMLPTTGKRKPNNPALNVDMHTLIEVKDVSDLHFGFLKNRKNGGFRVDTHRATFSVANNATKPHNILGIHYWAYAHGLRKKDELFCTAINQLYSFDRKVIDSSCGTANILQ